MDLKRRVDAVIDGAMAAERIVGAVVLVKVDGVSAYRRAGGLMDREAAVPMRDDAVFRLASVTKLVVAATALALVGQRRLDLDDPVARWLPEFRPTLPDGCPAQMTVRHLLTHTACLSYGFIEAADGPYHRAGVSDGLDLAGLTLAENLRRLASVPLLFEPGTAWNYSLSIDVLGAVIERAAHEALPEAVRRLVTEPLGMADTGFSVPGSVPLAAAYADHTPVPRRMRGADGYPGLDGLAPLAVDLARAYDAGAFLSGGGGMVAPPTICCDCWRPSVGVVRRSWRTAWSPRWAATRPATCRWLAGRAGPTASALACSRMLRPQARRSRRGRGVGAARMVTHGSSIPPGR